jgi:hypothetical protein
MNAQSATSQKHLEWVRHQVDAVLADLFTRKRDELKAIGLDSELHVLEEFAVRGGKRVRAAFCYWGWRGAGGTHEQAVMSAAAAEERPWPYNSHPSRRRLNRWCRPPWNGHGSSPGPRWKKSSIACTRASHESAATTSAGPTPRAHRSPVGGAAPCKPPW